MITEDGFFSWAQRDLGPPGKVNGGRNGGRGMICHSAEGYRTILREILFGPRRASWGASNLVDGQFIQHYPVWAQTWTSGAGFPNNNFFTTENEGVAGIALTQPQIDNLIRAGRELRELQGWTPRRPTSIYDLGASLYEHNECVRWGAEYTSCPSGRIPWLTVIKGMENQMDAPTKDEFGALFRLVLEQMTVTRALGTGLIAVAKTVGVEQAAQNALEDAVDAQQGRIENIEKLLKP